MCSLIEKVEEIARNPEFFLSIKFFLFYSRFEYALKQAGYVESDRNNNAKANWISFAQEHPEVMENRSRNPLLNDAVALLENNPPKKQMYYESQNELRWKNDDYNEEFNLSRALTLVCRIRNNLFHGGKSVQGPIDEISRDTRLLKAGLTILLETLNSDESVKKYFIDSFLE
jgi:hypothetical protein